MWFVYYIVSVILAIYLDKYIVRSGLIENKYYKGAILPIIWFIPVLNLIMICIKIGTWIYIKGGETAGEEWIKKWKQKK